MPYHLATVPYEIRNAARSLSFSGAGDEARTRYLDLGKVALYQMSYARRTMVIIVHNMAIVKDFFHSFRIISIIPQASVSG